MFISLWENLYSKTELIIRRPLREDSYNGDGEQVEMFNSENPQRTLIEMLIFFETPCTSILFFDSNTFLFFG